VENEILKAFKALDLMDASELVNTRRAKFIEMGVFDG
jgi:acetyl-CoA carboxylase alpha subunit